MSSTSHPTHHSKTKYEWVSDMFQFSKPKILKTKKKKASAPAIFNTEPAPNPGQLSIKSSQESSHSTNTIQSISKPTDFEHGIHIEYNDQSGRFMVYLFPLLILQFLMLNLGSSRCLETNTSLRRFIKYTIFRSSISSYNPTMYFYFKSYICKANSILDKFQPGASCPTISSPYNLKHNMNIHVDEIGNTSAVVN
jgi:hypothetical protein